jgi:hypothetical protein
MQTPVESNPRLAVLFLACPLAGCTSYPDRTEAAFTEFRSGRFESALKQYHDPDTTGAPFLQWAESGMVAFATGDWKHATDCLGRAAIVVKQVEQKALLSPGKLLTLGAESLHVYDGEGYERVMLHASLALTYLAQGLLEDARVDLLLADKLLRSEEELYAKNYRAGGLGQFVSGIAYELAGRPDEAYIDYKRMESTGVGPELFAPALTRLAQSLGSSDELALWQQRYHAEPQKQEGKASVVVIAGVGLGPFKKAVWKSKEVPVPPSAINPHGGMATRSWSDPVYESRPQLIPFVTLAVDGDAERIESIVIEDVARALKENLDDRIAHKLFGAESGQADLRAWETLPNTWQAAQVFLDPGVHELSVSAGLERAQLGLYELQAGETLFVFARTLDTQLCACAVGGTAVHSATH